MASDIRMEEDDNLKPITQQLRSKANIVSGNKWKDPEHQSKDPEVSNGIPQECFFDRRMPSVVTIFRYPNFLKDSKSEKAYVPQAVSLGPYHSSRANLSGMHDHKKRALHRMMTRFNDKHGNHPHDREPYNREIAKISQDDKAVWNNYEDKFVKPCDLVLDGCFLLEILRTLGGEVPNWEGSNCYEPIFDQRKIEFTGFDILSDILKVENQIPLIVLRKLLQLECKSVDRADKSLFKVLVKNPGRKFYPFDYDTKQWSWPQPVEEVHHLLGLLHNLIKSPPKPPPKPVEQPDEQVHHCLGLLHNLIKSPPSNDGDEQPDEQVHHCLGLLSLGLLSSPSTDYGSLPSGVSPPSNDGDERAIQIDDNGKQRCIPTAVQLSNVGIKFQPCNEGIMEIKFDRSKATINLPPINVTDYTEVLFSNLIALELCQTSGHNYVTSYLSLMDNLIDTNEDVAVLKKSKIVENYLGSEAEVAKLFNGLCKGVCLPREDVFEELHNNVMNHYNNNFKVWFAQFIKDYVSSPWKFLAFLGAILALVLTLLQTIYSILAYYK